MNKERTSYLQNKRRVYEIYGIDPKDRHYSIHHILFRSDFKKGGFARELGRKYMNSKANLCPLRKEEHRRLHEELDKKENRV